MNALPFYALVRSFLVFVLNGNALVLFQKYCTLLIFVKKMEMVQRRAARFVKGCYSREPGTVTALLKDLEWQSLEMRRKLNRLAIFYKATHGLVAVSIPEYVQRPTRQTRQFHQSKCTQISTSTSYYNNSFFPRTIVDWNDLPPSVIEAPSIEAFKIAAQKHLISM